MGNIDIGAIIINFVVFLFSLTLHELGHAWTSEKFGDPTGRYEGRISLDPTVHIDPLGTIILPLIGMISGGFMIGWAKPVPVDPNQWRNKVVANIAVSAAGPAANFLIMVVALTIMKVIYVYQPNLGIYQTPVSLILNSAVMINLVLGLFNLLPIPPLDGSHILSSILSVVNPELMDNYESLRPYGFMILMALGISGIIGFILRPLIGIAFNAIQIVWG